MIIVPTLHPAALLRGDDTDMGLARFEQTCINDMRKAAKLLRQRPEWDESCIWDRDSTGRFVNLFPMKEEVISFLDTAWKWCQYGGYITCDVETTGESPLQCKLICVGLSVHYAGQDRVLCIPVLRQGGYNYWSDADARDVFSALGGRFLANPIIRKVFHNGSFDTAVLYSQGLSVEGWTDDTMAQHHIVDSELPNGLGYVASMYLDTRFWKDDVKGGTGWLDLDDIVLRSYNLRDCLSTARIFEPMKKQIMQYGLTALYEQEVELAHIMTRATIRGFAIDFERRDSTKLDKTGMPIGLGPKLIIQSNDALSTLRSIAGSAIDPNKPVHLRYLLFDQLKFPVVKETGTGLASTDKEALMLLALLSETDAQRAAIHSLAQFRQAEKLLSTFIRGLPILADGRFHPTWKLLATSGRFMSSPNCFDALTETLTLERGWVSMANVQPFEHVAQWHENGSIDFVIPDLIRGYSDAPLVTIKNQHIDLAMTRDHRALLRHRKTSELREFRADQYQDDWQQLHAGIYAGGSGLQLSDDELRLLVAMQADGKTSEFIRGYGSFGFTRKRKVVRMEAMLRRMGLKYKKKERWNLPDQEYRCDFTISRSSVFERLLQFLGQKKEFGAWLLIMTRHQIDVFLEEIWHWDGHLARRNMYSSSTPGNAAWVQALLVLSDTRTNVREYTSIAGNQNWQTDVTRRNYSMTTNVERGELGVCGTPVFCVSVPSSYILVRRNGKTAITGNCQNWGRAVKRIFRAGIGNKLIGVDLSQAELRGIAYISDDKDLLEMYEKDINVHTVNATLLFQVRAPSGHKNINTQTEVYARAACLRLLGVDYDTLPECPNKQWKDTRTLAKNFVFGCLARGTKVAVLDARGEVPIEELRRGDWVWCWDGRKYTPTRVKRIWKTGNKQCVRLSIRDEVGTIKTLWPTLNHRMLMRDNSKRAVKDLLPGDRLMPFRRYVMTGGYREIDPQNDGGRAYEHRWVIGAIDHLPVHHVDGNRANNTPENLIRLTSQQHRALHSYTPTTAERQRMAESARVQWATNRNEMIERLTAARVSSEKWQQSVRSPEMIAKRVESFYKTISKRPPKPPCKCGHPSFVKGLCKRCYNREYRFKKNHTVVSVGSSVLLETWDLEVEHPSHNFALGGSVFVSNSSYGAEDETLHQVLRSKRDVETNEILFPKLQISEVQAMRVQWFTLHPSIPKWWKTVTSTIPKQGFYKCPLSGRRRWFRGGFKRNEMINVGIQTLVASWMNNNMVEIQHTYDAETGGAAQIVQQVHDALTVEAPAEYATRAGQVMTDCLSRTFPLPGHPQARLPPDPVTIGTYLDEV